MNESGKLLKNNVEILIKQIYINAFISCWNIFFRRQNSRFVFISTFHTVHRTQTVRPQIILILNGKLIPPSANTYIMSRKI